MHTAPCFVINMKKCSDRLERAMHAIQRAGFSNIVRFDAIDATEPGALKAAWEAHGSPKMGRDRSFFDNIGEQGCTVSHLSLWRRIIEEGIEMAVVFEDDVLFHSQWEELWPQYWEETPRDFDILYLGSQFDGDGGGQKVIQTHVYCTHAYVITLAGARKLYEHVMRLRGMYVIDCMLRDGMLMNEKPFIWYVWNGLIYPDYDRRGTNENWVIRNCGLVYQDENAGSFVKPRGGKL